MKFFQDIIKNLSIRKKVMMLSMITSTISVIITCTGFIFFTIFEERNEMVEEHLIISKILSEDISEAVAYKDKMMINESLLSLKMHHSIVQACVYDNKGEEISYFPNENLFANCDNVPSLNKKFEFSKNGILKDHLIIKSEIKYENKKYGSIYTIASLERINDKIIRSLYNSTILFFIILIISYIISRILQKNVSEPIINLADISYAVKSGDYKIRAKHISSDEIGELTEAFNNMLNVIQDSQENLEKKVRKRTYDLEKAMSIKADFLSNMSHEIRTPIHGIMNYADFLVNDWNILEENKRFEFLKKLYSNSDRLLSLINNLLDLSKLNAKKMEFFFEENNLVELVENAIIEAEPLYIEKDLNVTLDYNNIIDIKVAFDEERIAQVIRNLLSNAIKFTPKGQITARIFLSKNIKSNGFSEDGIMFSLEDEGIGIPTDELKHIFDKFNQSRKTKTGAGGTGLGLAISNDIIKSHNGRIWAENNINKKGATFFFIIPIKQVKNKLAKPKRKSY